MIPKETINYIIAYYQQGLSVPELSRQYAINEKSIYYLFQKHGVALRPRSGVGKKLSQEQDAAILVSYQQGTDAVYLANQYGISSTTIYKLLEKHGIKRRTNSDIFRKLSQEQETDILALYQQDIPGSQIASQYDIEDQTVYNILERHGVQRKSTSQAAITYTRNEHAFDVIQTEEAAYWLGFIAADGNVSNGRLRIGLSTRDADHLRKFAAWLAPDMPLYTGTNNLGRPVTTFEIGSQHLVEALAESGIVPRKTYVMKHLPSLPHVLMRHFLRGYVDGDGYFSKTGARFGVVAFQKTLVEEIQAWFLQELTVSRTSLIQSGSAWHYRQYGTIQVSKIASYLYSDASVYLERKYHLAQRILSHSTATPINRLWQPFVETDLSISTESSDSINQTCGEESNLR